MFKAASRHQNDATGVFIVNFELANTGWVDGFEIIK